MLIIQCLLSTVSFSIDQKSALTKAFIPNEQFDRDLILKVTLATYYLDFASLNCGTNLPKANNQPVLGVLLFASIRSTNMG